MNHGPWHSTALWMILRGAPNCYSIRCVLPKFKQHPKDSFSANERGGADQHVPNDIQWMLTSDIVFHSVSFCHYQATSDKLTSRS